MNTYKNELPFLPVMLAIVVLLVLLLNIYSLIITL